MQSFKTTPKGTGACLAVAALFLGTPAAIGYQDLTSLMARKAAVSDDWNQRLAASPLGNFQTAAFTFPHPVGMMIPDSLAYRLVSLTSGAAEVTGSIPTRTSSARADSEDDLVFPWVDRQSKTDRIGHAAHAENGRAPKGDRLALAAPVVPAPGAAPPVAAAPAISPPATVASPETPSADGATPAGAPGENGRAIDPNSPHQSVTIPAATLEQVKLSAEALQADEETSEFDSAAPAFNDAGTTRSPSQVFFGATPMGPRLASLQPWAPGEEPVLVEPIDPDGKPPARGEGTSSAKGESVANKGEVTGEGHRPESPAQRLGLTGKARAKAEKCLTDAVYFEARGEPVRGQMAVAQVVMNRVFSGYYPHDVCGVVYQNASHHLACQFTFACDGIPERVTEPDAWARAKRIARDTLDGKIWVPDVGKATHYHAYWVHPRWVHEMKKMLKLGVHTFYRPRNWGDGSDAPKWGDAATTAAEVKKL